MKATLAHMTAACDQSNEGGSEAALLALSLKPPLAPYVGEVSDPLEMASWLGATVADGIGAPWLGKATMLDVVALKSVGAIPIWLFSRSYTT